MSIQHFNSYPQFYANQVLKSSDLNRSFGFLDEQARLSRLHLVGQGIIDGLDLSFTEKRILCIKKGRALDSGGWFVQLTEDALYPFVAEVPYSEAPFETDNLESLVTGGGSRIQYICFKTEDDARELGLTPIPITAVPVDNLLIALAYGTRRDLSNRCSHDSCDINVTSLLTEAWPVLVKQGPAPLFHQLAATDQYIYPFMPVQLSPSSNIKAFNKAVRDAFNQQRSELVSVMKTIFTQVFGQKYVLPKKNATGFVTQKTPWDHVLPKSRTVFGRMYGCILKTERLLSSGKEDFVPDFFLSYLDDLRLAVNELIEAYNEFAVETRFIPDWIPQGRLTYLGLASRAYDPRYKSLFRKADIADSDHGIPRLERMISRLSILSKNFIGTRSTRELAAKPENIVPSRPGARLSEKPIPFYYENPHFADFIEAWNADKPTSYRTAPDQGSVRGVNQRKKALMAPAAGMEYRLEAFHYKNAYSLMELMDDKSPLGWMNLKLVNVPMDSCRRLTAAQADLIKAYFASNHLRKATQPTKKMIDLKMSWLTDTLWLLQRSTGNNKQKLDAYIDALRDGDDCKPVLTFSFRQSLNEHEEDLWVMTRRIKEALGLDYTDKKNKFADPVYSAFLNLLNILAARSAPAEIDLTKAFLNGPIRPGCTVGLLSKENKAFSYVVLY